MRRTLISALLILLAAASANAASVTHVETPLPVREIIQSRGGVFVRTFRDTYRAIGCGGRICLKATRVKGDRKTAINGLPDGEIALRSKGDIRAAWYATPTRRYQHAVLGDNIEAGTLVVIDQNGKRQHLELSEDYVFEDITPRLFDLTNDGRTEVITIRSSVDRGAAIAIFGLRGGTLQLIAATPEIGQRNRWLNISGIAKYFGSPVPVLTWVQTPHIGGVLHMAVLRDGKLEEFRPPEGGYSNHVIGSRNLRLSATADFDGDGRLDLALPSANRTKLRFLMMSGNRDVRVNDPVSMNMAPIAGGVLVGTEDGKLYHVKP